MTDRNWAALLPRDRDEGTGASPYERIKEGILNATFEPGQPLVESAIAEWCGVSRTPVREALLRLEHDGMVERGDRGLVVRQRSPEQILDIYETRIVLETAAASAAAERHGPLDKIRLKRVLEDTSGPPPDDTSELVGRNKRFHAAVWSATHNDSLIDLLTRVNLHLVRYPATTLSFPGRWETAAEEHGALIEAILSRDSALAASVAAKHFTAARDIRIRLWEQDQF